MTWEIFLGIVALIGFVISISTPLIKLNTSITKLNTSLSNINKNIDELKQNSKVSHDEIWLHNDEQDKKIEDCEHRITVVETVIFNKSKL